MKTSKHFSLLAALSLSGIITAGLVIWTPAVKGQETAALAKEIQQRVAAIHPHDAAGHQALAQFLYNNRLYQQALEQVNAALKIKPDFQNAQLLKNLINQALSQQPGEQNTTGAGNQGSGANTTTAPATTAAATPPPLSTGKTLLTTKDVYKIRFWQLSRHEVGPIEATIVNRRKTLLSFWRNVVLRNPMYQNSALTRQDYEQFISLNNLDRQIYLFRRLGTQKYWDRVQLSSDPQVLRIYRTDIEPVVLQSCGTIGCHRGQNSPGFRLYQSNGSESTRKTYTNFLTLTRFKYHDMPLINLQNPRMSLLLQYLQPAELQAYSHPGKKGPAPLHFNKNMIVNWIESLRYPIHSYGFTSPAAQTQPAATKPAQQ